MTTAMIAIPIQPLIQGFLLGASKMSSIFRSTIAWRTLDMVSGCLMVAIAGSIVMAV